VCSQDSVEVGSGLVGATFALREVSAAGGRLVLRGTVQLELPVPRQDEHLPHQVEQAVEDAGQRLKRWAFQQFMERLDAELLLAERGGKEGQGIVCRGRRSTTFKTIFGTVTVSRRRIQQKADGTMETPAARVWKTPQQVTITQGLRDATCDAMLRESSRKSLREIERHAGERELLGRMTVLNLVHQEGRSLRAAAKRRAHAVFLADPEARRCLLPSVCEPTAQEPSPWNEPCPDAEEPLPGFPGAPKADAVEEDEPRRVDDDTVMVQADEVLVDAQASTGCKQVKVYTAVVTTGENTWYFCEENARSIIYLVGALLAVLKVPEGKLRLLFVNDGARWIRDWFERLQVSGKTMVLCWYHLAKRCFGDLGQACSGRKHRDSVCQEVLAHLWEGRVDEALAFLAQHRKDKEVRSRPAWDQFVEYVQSRRPYLPNYRERQQAGLWIASNRVEKLNDWAVSQRCKGNGMDWTPEGVLGLAVLEAARRNGELPIWRSTRALPAWATEPDEPVAA
jgi:uncharacterized protein UPF0236